VTSELADAPAVDDVELVDAPVRTHGPVPWLLLGGGLIGLVAACVLLFEKIKLLENPSYVPSCNFNPVLSCGTIMRTDQASVFGFPNPMLGLVGFAMVVATGAALLAGARFARWYWLGMQAGVLFGIGFVAWLAFQSLYRIGALCPYCMVVWAVVLPIFWWVTARNAEAGVLGLPRGLAEAVADYRWLLLIGSYALIVVPAFFRFSDYWLTLV